MQDNRKSSLVARISIQVVDYYRQAMRGLDDSNISSLLGSKKSKTWKKVLTIKMNHYTSVAFVSLLIEGGFGELSALQRFLFRGCSLACQQEI